MTSPAADPGDPGDDLRREHRVAARTTVVVLDVDLDRLLAHEAHVVDASASAARLTAPGWDPPVGEIVHLACDEHRGPVLCRVQQRRGAEVVVTLVTPSAAPLGLADGLGLAPTDPPAAPG
ncbi:MAG TPA: PilZ domain-containing protein [Acidimicrobiales bacterium]|nr:PilZ domain-containing protein [Acidimicrobiales bacterium]